MIPRETPQLTKGLGGLIKIGVWWDWLIKIVVPAGLLFVVIYGGFMNDISPEGYEGYFNWSWPIWTILGVTLILSFVLQAVKTRTLKGGE